MTKRLAQDHQPDSSPINRDINSKDTLSVPTTTVIDLLASIGFNIARIRNEQMKDPDLRRRICLVNKNPRNFPSEIIDQGILFKVINQGDDDQLRLPWILASLIPEILHAYHDHPFSGHFGINRTYHKAKEKFFWLKMFDTIKAYIRSCSQCSQSNVQRQKKTRISKTRTTT